MIVIGEEGAQSTVHKTARQDFVVRSLTFTTRETTREAAESGILLLVFYLEGHEVNPRISILGCAYSSQQDGVTHAKGYRSVSLLGEFPCLDDDLSTIGQCDCFANWL